MTARPLLAEPMNIPAILAEHATGEARVVKESYPDSTPFHAFVAAIRDVDRCETCGKTRAVVNVAPRRGIHHQWKDEPVSPETHCACKGGPAYTPPAVDAHGTELSAGIAIEAITNIPFAHTTGALRWIIKGEKGRIEHIDCTTRMVTIQFDAYPQPYLCNVAELRARVKVIV